MSNFEVDVSIGWPTILELLLVIFVGKNNDLMACSHFCDLINKVFVITEF